MPPLASCLRQNKIALALSNVDNTVQMQNTRKENADEQGSTTSATMVTKEKNDDDDSSVSTTSTDATKEMESLADEGDNDNDDDYDDDDDDDMTVHLDIIDIGADDTDGDDDDVRDSSRACATADRSKKDDGHSDNENENDVGQKQLTAKQQCRKIRFEQHRDKVLSDIPQHFKDRFGKIFFTMRSRFFRPVLVLNPFSISPGRERYSWCEKYDKVNPLWFVSCFLVLASWGSSILTLCLYFPNQNGKIS